MDHFVIKLLILSILIDTQTSSEKNKQQQNPTGIVITFNETDMIYFEHMYLLYH